MQQIKLTEHFNLAEFTRSATAEANGIKNSLDNNNHNDRKVIENLTNLCVQVLEPLRNFAEAPVIVSSGYRCRALNDLVGGSKNSQHLTGEAADIVVSDGGNIKEWFLFIQNNCWFDQLILETKGNKRWIHVSCRRNNQKNQMSARTMRT